jgi:hypothetical protein
MINRTLIFLSSLVFVILAVHPATPQTASTPFVVNNVAGIHVGTFTSATGATIFLQGYTTPGDGGRRHVGNRTRHVDLTICQLHVSDWSTNKYSNADNICDKFSNRSDSQYGSNGFIASRKFTAGN